MTTARTTVTTISSSIDTALVEETEEGAPQLEMPTLVKMKFQRKHAMFTLHKLAQNLLGRLQVAVPDVCFGPVDDEDCLLPRLSKTNDLPKDDTTLKKYMKDVKITHNGYGFARVKIHSQVELYEIEAKTQAIEFVLKLEISLEYWPLETVSPVNVGFLYNNIPRKDTMMLHQRRMEKMLEKKYNIYNRFQLSKQALVADNGRKRCFVIMIKSSEEDAKILHETLLQINEYEDLSYCSWDKFMKLDDSDRLELVKDQKAFNFSLRSLIIPGFIDNEDDIPMVYYEDDDEPVRNETIANPLEKIVITEYLLKHVQSGRDVPLFEYVYPPALGKREVVVTKQHYHEALSYIKRCHGELARNMNDRAIVNCFQDPQAAKNGSLEKPWIGFQMWKKIPEAIIPESRKKKPMKLTKKPGICFGKATTVSAEPRNEPCIPANVVTTDVDVSALADEIHPHYSNDELAEKIKIHDEQMSKMLDMTGALSSHMNESVNKLLKLIEVISDRQHEDKSKWESEMFLIKEVVCKLIVAVAPADNLNSKENIKNSALKFSGNNKVADK